VSEQHTAGQVDLDEVQRRVGVLDHDLTNGLNSAIKAAAAMIAGWYVEDCDRMAAELRAARRSVDFARGTARLFSGSPHGDAAAEVIAAYDQAVGGGS
jgi:hypothetical protein